MKKDNLDWSEVEEISHLVKKAPISEPSHGMDEKFYSMLEMEKRSQGSLPPNGSALRERSLRNLHPAWWVAASIAFLMIGWIGASMLQTGNSGRSEISLLSTEVKELKESLVLTMIRQSSPGERIRAVSLVSGMETIDARIIESLMVTLNNDEDSDVRLVALEALVKYADMPEVREGMIQSIDKQLSPEVLLRLTQIMIKLQEKRSVPEFMNRINDVKLDFDTRTKLNETVRYLL
jgi:hypothetical protein